MYSFFIYNSKDVITFPTTHDKLSTRFDTNQLIAQRHAVYSTNDQNYPNFSN